MPTPALSHSGSCFVESNVLFILAVCHAERAPSGHNFSILSILNILSYIFRSCSAGGHRVSPPFDKFRQWIGMAGCDTAV
jgi:hypothetical protein